MLRVISGKHRGRAIIMPKSDGVRPTSGFAREAIFNILQHGAFSEDGAPYIDKHVADICCGSGAMGFEALSRGAAKATFVDTDKAVFDAVKKTAEIFKEDVQCVHSHAENLPRAREAVDVLFIDPPYYKNLLAASLLSAQKQGWLHAATLIVAEHAVDEEFICPKEFALLDTRRYGRAVVCFMMPAS